MRVINQTARGNQLVAFFQDQSDALSAISELKDAGFTSNQIGFAIAGQSDVTRAGTSTTAGRQYEEDRSMWEKMKDFFSGEHESYRGPSQDYQNTFSHLSLSPEQTRYYSEGITAGGALVTVSAVPERLSAAREILLDNDADLRTSGFEQPAATRTGNLDVGSATERRVELRGELLRAVKQRVQSGEIRLRKDVVTENQTINVPVTREDVIIV